MKPAAFLFATVAASVSYGAASHPGLLSDLPDDVLAALARDVSATASPAATLDAIAAVGSTYVFPAPGLNVVTDRRWFQVQTVDGVGAPIVELRRWPGDTVLAYYELPPSLEQGSTLPAGVKLLARRAGAGAWACRDAKLAATRGDFGAVWCELAVGTTRRLGALGVPGDAGLGPAALPDLRESILAVLKSTEVVESTVTTVTLPLAPQIAEAPDPADERRRGWSSFQGADFTLGLPPGLRALRLDAGVPPPRPMPYAAAWIRGRFDDRDGLAVAVGDATHAGYVATLAAPDEEWRAGVAPPLGAPGAEREDEARLDDTVLEWTGASRAVVSHWKETAFAGDWLVFRLLVSGRGVEIGLPVVSGWRSLALFWIPVSYRSAGRPPAPPPIDPAESLGVHFKRLRPAEAKLNGLLEGYLTVADLRLEIPRGWWPVANLDSRDGLPLTFLDPAGIVLGQLDRRPAGSADLEPNKDNGWEPVLNPAAQHALAIWGRVDGHSVLVAKDGHGFLLIPAPDVPDRQEGWRRIRESADFIRAARH